MNDALYLSQVTPEAPVARRDLVNRWVFGLAIANVVGQIAIMLGAAAVHVAKLGLASIGANCPDWPACGTPPEGLPFAGQYNTIHLLHIAAIGITVVLTIALVVATVEMMPTKRRALRIHVVAALPLVVIGLQGLVLLLMRWLPNLGYLEDLDTLLPLVAVAVGAGVITRLGAPDVSPAALAGWQTHVLTVLLGVTGVISIVANQVLFAWAGKVGERVALPAMLEGDRLGYAHIGVMVLFGLALTLGLVWAIRAQAPGMRALKWHWIVVLSLVVVQLALVVFQTFFTPYPVVLTIVVNGLIIVGLVVLFSRLYPRIPVLSLSLTPSPQPQP